MKGRYLILYKSLKFQNQVYIYDWTRDSWTSLGPMQTERYYHGCGLALRAVDAASEVVVAGGFREGSAEILNLATREWRYPYSVPIVYTLKTSKTQRLCRYFKWNNQ